MDYADKLAREIARELNVTTSAIKWPYICTTSCTQRYTCTLPKCSYNGNNADENYRKILFEARAKILISKKKLPKIFKFL